MRITIALFSCVFSHSIWQCYFADPNGDGVSSDAVIAGRIALVASAETLMDDVVVGNAGMGGQGVLPIPVVYDGWVQHLPEFWSNQLTGVSTQSHTLTGK